MSRAHYIIFGFLGLILTAIVVQSIFIPDPQNAAPFTLTSPPAPVGSAEFLTTLSHLTGNALNHDDAATMISDTAFLPTLLATINHASTSINIADYPWQNGSFSDQIFTALTVAAQRGVTVRVILDSFGGSSVSGQHIATLKKAGGIVAWYHPFLILNPMQFDERNHVRTFIIDGTTAFVGSVGIEDRWIMNTNQYNQYNDFMVEVNNTAAQSVQEIFAELWREVTGEFLTGHVFYPPLPSTKKNTLSSSTATTTKINTLISIPSFPPQNTNPIRDTFMLTALSAQKKLYILNTVIIPDKNFLAILEAKARDGVDVRILSPGTVISPFILSAWHADYTQLLEAGVKLYEYQPSMIHAKMMLADDVWSVVGSADIDNRSYELNTENLMGIADPLFNAQLNVVFANDLSQSKQITLADWQKEYGFFSKLFSYISLALFKQY